MTSFWHMGTRPHNGLGLMIPPMIEAIGILYLIIFGLLLWSGAPIGIALTFAALSICMFFAAQWARSSLTI